MTAARQRDRDPARLATAARCGARGRSPRHDPTLIARSGCHIPRAYVVWNRIRRSEASCPPPSPGPRTARARSSRRCGRGVRARLPDDRQRRRRRGRVSGRVAALAGRRPDGRRERRGLPGAHGHAPRDRPAALGAPPQGDLRGPVPARAAGDRRHRDPAGGGGRARRLAHARLPRAARRAHAGRARACSCSTTCSVTRSTRSPAWSTSRRRVPADRQPHAAQAAPRAARAPPSAGGARAGARRRAARDRSRRATSSR